LPRTAPDRAFTRVRVNLQVVTWRRLRNLPTSSLIPPPLPSPRVSQKTVAGAPPSRRQASLRRRSRVTVLSSRWPAAEAGKMPALPRGIGRGWPGISGTWPRPGQDTGTPRGLRERGATGAVRCLFRNALQPSGRVGMQAPAKAAYCPTFISAIKHCRGSDDIS